MGNLKITTHAASETEPAHYEVVFVPYSGRLNTKPAKASNLEDLVTLLSDLKLSEDDATKWAGRARAQGVILIASFERTDTLLREMGLLA